jgi:cell fate (sporulation/competence/biofilm development) regulator YlbF (YheA/YmcA/DUF963 family)
VENIVFEDIEIAPPSVVRQAARDFATALSETAQFKTFERAAYAFQRDQAAQLALQTYQQKKQSLRALIMLNALSVEQRTELEHLHNAFNNQKVVQDYIQAQTELASLCQVLGDMLSKFIGFMPTRRRMQ